MALDLTAPMPMPASASTFTGGETPGYRTPALTGTGCVFIRKPHGSCAGCKKANLDHKTMAGLQVVPATKRRLWNVFLNDLAQDVRDNIHSLRALIQWCDRQANGVFESSSISIGFVPPSKAAAWDLVSISGSTITCRYNTGDVDPRAVEFQQVSLNPSWPAPGESKWTVTTGYKALPTGGVVTLTAPSQLQWHHGTICYQVNVPSPDTFGDGDTFTLKVLGDLSGKGPAVWPLDSTDQIRVGYRIYNGLTAQEIWPGLRDEYRMFGEQKTYTINSPTQQEYTVVTERVAYHTDFFSASWVKNSVTEDVTSEMFAVLDVEHVGAANYKTVLDLTGVDLTGVTSITLTALEESGADYAAPCGQGRCANSIHDRTGSWGDADGSGTAYCALRATASLASTFRPACYQTKCTGWSYESTPANPLNLTVVAQLLAGLPWKVTQFGGYPQPFLDRFGAPSLFSLTDMIRIPNGQGNNFFYYLHCGVWAARATVAGLNRKLWGLEWGEFAGGGGAAAPPYFPSRNTWPDFGPAGANSVADKEAEYPLGGDDEWDLDSDSTFDQRATATHGAVTIDETTGTTAETLGKHQLTSDLAEAVQLQLWFPRLAADGSTEEFGDGTLTAGFWTAEGVEQMSEDGETRYYWKLSLSPRRRDAYGGLVTSPTVKRAHINDNILSLFFELGEQEISYPITLPDLTVIDRRVKWMQGGNVVALPPWARVRGQGNSLDGWGIDRGKARNGMSVKFTSGQGFSGAIADRQFIVRKATPCAHTAFTGSYKPGTPTQTLSKNCGGFFFVAIDSDEETVSGVTLTRNGGAVTLSEISNNDFERPYDMAKDEFYWEDFDSGGGLAGVVIWFSHLNGTNDTADNQIDYSITTDGGSSPYTGTIDLLNDATNGWNQGALSTVMTATRNIDSVQSVKVQKSDGTTKTLTAWDPSAPATWSDWDLDHYEATIDGNEVTIEVAPEYGSDTLDVVVEIDSQDSSSGYYTAMVAPAGERSLMNTANAPGVTGRLPRNHQLWANRCDRLDIEGENNVFDDLDASVFEGSSVQVRSDTVAVPGSLKIEKSHFDTDDADEDLTSQCLVFAAQGEVLLPDVIEEDDCLIVTGRFADRSCMPHATVDIESLRTTIQRALSE